MKKGTLACTQSAVESVDLEWLRQEATRQQIEAARRCEAYRKGKISPSLQDKTVIITDDGIATGLTMWLALAIVSAQHPKRIIMAVPVAPGEAMVRFKSEVSEFIA